MKKVMMALAITAVASVASAASCTEDCPFGYRLKVMVRTTASCNVDKKNACGDCDNNTYRAPRIRRFMGMVYGKDPTGKDQCGDTACGCNDWKNNANVAFFDYDNQLPMTLNNDATELIQLNRIGGCVGDPDRNKAELAFTVGFTCKKNVGTMTFAGFGLCGNHNGRVALGAVSGYCAGLLPAGSTSYNETTCKESTTCGNKVWNLCCDDAYVCNYTAAYGKWTLVWDASIADKFGSQLTAKKATTSWGVATPAQLTDGRLCSAPKCKADK